MARAILFWAITLLHYQSSGQTTIQTKEVKIPYTNGYEVFKVCITGCQTNFDDKKEYFWYTEFSKVKSTKGGSGGNLLHGNYKFYDEKGNLRQDKNYYLGLSDGTEKTWDSLGNVASITKYDKGKIIYWKFQNDDKYWIEYNGGVWELGTIRKTYTQYNSLISEEKMMSYDGFKQHIKEYYENSGKLKAEYTSTGMDANDLREKYTTYFENGKIQIDGQFYEGDYTNIQVGTWKYYKSDGTLEGTEQFKAEVEYWSNGEIKLAGGFVFDSENNTWIKTGKWKWYNEEGKLQSQKNYKRGVE